MYKLSIKTWWIICLFFLFYHSGQGQRIIQDVILIDVEPYEVRMTEEGRIIDRLSYLPDYFKDYEAKRGKTVQPGVTPDFAVHTTAMKVEEITIPEVKVTIKETVQNEITQKPLEEFNFPNQYNIFFEQGKATLSNEGIGVLDQLAYHLLSQPNISVIAITFHYEPVTIAQLLSQRRRDACIAYLEIKGVDVDEQVVRGGISQSQVNKVFFGLKSK